MPPRPYSPSTAGLFVVRLAVRQNQFLARSVTLLQTWVLSQFLLVQPLSVLKSAQVSFRLSWGSPLSFPGMTVEPRPTCGALVLSRGFLGGQASL